MIRETTQDEQHFELLRRIGLQSVMIVPLAARGRAIGALTLATAESRRRYTDEDLAVAVELGRRAALFVDNARLYERERRIATTLQQAFLPTSLPEVPGFTLDVAFTSGSEEANLGGDWYDAFWLPDGRIGISIGDVMGHGLRAAGFMGLVRQTIRAGAYDRDRPAAILSRANQLLRLSHDADTATALVAILDVARSTLTYASAGHPVPIAAGPGGDAAAGAPGGPPLGLAPAREEYRDDTIALEPGTLVVLYTDGLTEYARDPLAGEERLRSALHGERRKPTAKPADSIMQRVMGGAKPSDDVAVLTISVASAPLDGLDLSFPAIPGSLPVLRQSLRRFLAGCGVEPSVTSAMQVAVGEAANNVIEHAYGVLRGTLSIRARLVGGDVVVEVADRGTWRRGRMDGGGRGLRIMRGLVEKVDIVSEAAGTTVRLVVPRRKAVALRQPTP
jgi:serine phosphatase RsbU (regulator of sigma subunit)/anti-sigma regulatory factor (Ser/Thr protein kinase)